MFRPKIWRHNSSLWCQVVTSFPTSFCLSAYKYNFFSFPHQISLHLWSVRTRFLVFSHFPPHIHNLKTPKKINKVAFISWECLKWRITVTLLPLSSLLLQPLLLHHSFHRAWCSAHVLLAKSCGGVAERNAFWHPTSLQRSLPSSPSHTAFLEPATSSSCCRYLTKFFYY